jgi:16S rRNA (uracil1498-N3)-methyltransferase
MDDGRNGAIAALMPSPAHRFAIDGTLDPTGLVRIEGAELHHMRDVMRLRPGAPVSLLDPAGVEHRGVIERYEREQAVIRIESSTQKNRATRIILAAAIIKGPRMDFTVEKAAELGASELWPLICTHGVVRSPGAERVARWRRLALAAAKQSQSATAMEVRSPMSVDDLIRAVPSATLAVVCAQGGEPLGDVIRRERPGGILIAVGPEGDFDELELNKFAHAGFVLAGLGPNRLRSETAALAALSIAAGLL